MNTQKSNQVEALARLQDKANELIGTATRNVHLFIGGDPRLKHEMMQISIKLAEAGVAIDELYEKLSK